MNMLILEILSYSSFGSVVNLEYDGIFKPIFSARSGGSRDTHPRPPGKKDSGKNASNSLL